MQLFVININMLAQQP